LYGTYLGILQNHTLLIAGGLAYSFALCIFPALILFFALLTSLPIPDLFGPLTHTMFRLLPADTVHSFEAILLDALRSNRRAWLSFGSLGTLWIVSATFRSLIEALDLAYEVSEERSFWKNFLVSLLLAAVTSGLLIFGLSSTLVGPHLGEWFAQETHAMHVLVVIWPALHWLASVCFVLITVELIYFLAPNVKQRFLATLPGAALTVLCWIGLSYLLGFYFRHLANFGITYGTLAAFVVLMIWLYWNSLVLLVGAELNAELAKESGQGAIPQNRRPDSLEEMPHAA
jgi:membrane protein